MVKINFRLERVSAAVTSAFGGVPGRVMVAGARTTFDRRTMTGMFIGAAIMLSALATAESSGSTSWYSSLFSTSGSTSSSTLLSQEDSVVATAIQSTPCTIQDAIDQAVKVHTDLAVAGASPAVEGFFVSSTNCFAGLLQLIDLSFAIPSLGSIIAAAQTAVLQFLEKKICTAINQVTGMVLAPINQAISQINGVIGTVNSINGMVDSMASTGLKPIGASTVSAYNPSISEGTYTVTSNFGSGQTTFTSTGTSTGTTTTTGTNSSGGSGDSDSSSSSSAPVATPAPAASSATGISGIINGAQ